MLEDYRNSIAGNLKDAGCSENVQQQFLEKVKADDIRGAKRILVRHRMEIMEEYHRVASQVDALDFLIRKIEKEEKNNK